MTKAAILEELSPASDANFSQQPRLESAGQSKTEIKLATFVIFFQCFLFFALILYALYLADERKFGPVSVVFLFFSGDLFIKLLRPAIRALKRRRSNKAI